MSFSWARGPPRCPCSPWGHTALPRGALLLLTPWAPSVYGLPGAMESQAGFCPLPLRHLQQCPRRGIHVSFLLEHTKHNLDGQSITANSLKMNKLWCISKPQQKLFLGSQLCLIQSVTNSICCPGQHLSFYVITVLNF